MTITSLVAAWTVDRRRRWQGVVLAVVLGIVGFNAIYGGVGLMRDGMGMPAEWVDRLPFGSWALAGVALLVGVAAPQFAACWLVLAGHPRAALAAAAAGTVLVAWIVVQVLVLRRYFVLQPVIAGLGLVEVSLAWWWLRSARASMHRTPPLAVR
jgi:hypothetical protein